MPKLRKVNIISLCFFYVVTKVLGGACFYCKLCCLIEVFGLCESKDLFLSPWPCIHNHRTFLCIFCPLRGTTPPYLHTSLLTYFGSPITPISLLSDAIHHRSGFSPRPPHSTYLGTYVLLLCRHSSHPCPLWAFYLHSLSSDATTYFWSTHKCTTCAHTILISWILKN